jgi:hypothetical protein
MPSFWASAPFDLDLPVLAEVGVLLADDLAVEFVLTDRARERTCDPDCSGRVRLVASQEEALAGEELPFEAAGQSAGISTSIEMSPETNIIAPASEVSRSPG